MEDVVVVGGGIAGLTAARGLSESGRTVTVLDANSWIGGRLRTLQIGDAPVDVGASFFQDFYPNTLALVKSVGLSGSLGNFPLNAGVMRGGELRPVWPGGDLVKGGLLSVPSLVRLAAGTAGALLPRWRSLNPDDLLSAVKYDDETVEKWSVRVLGREATEYFITPLLRGVVHWDAETTSRAVLFTILKASLKYRAAYHLIGGMSSLCDRMAPSATVKSDARVVSVMRESDRWQVRYESNGTVETLEAAEVVCAVPADIVCNIIPELNSEEREFFGNISYSSTAVAVVEVGGRQGPQRASVFFNAREEPVIEGVNPYYASEGPKECEFVRISISTSAYIANEGLSDGELGDFIVSAASRVPYLASELTGGRVVGIARWRRALPVFDVGHLRRIQRWQGRPRQFKSLVFAGDYLCGPYVEGAVRSGLRASSDLLGEPRPAGRQR